MWRFAFKNYFDAPTTERNPQNQSDEKNSQEVVDQFLSELRTDPMNSSYEKCVSDSNVNIWRKKADDSGVYRLKLIGYIPYSIEVVDKALFDHKLRLQWDQILETIHEVETRSDGTVLLYIAARAPFGISYRDFVHIRTRRELPPKKDFPENRPLVVVDMSTEHQNFPERSGYVRATTTFSGGVLEPFYLKNSQEVGTLYSMITQVDLKGVVPKSIVNLFSTKATKDWFESLCQGCNVVSQI